MRKIEGIIFDLDGVITDTAKYHFLAWRNLARELGIDFTEEFNETLKGISRIESLERILEFGNIENKFSDEEKNNLATKKNDEYVKLLANLSEKDILEGIYDLLVETKEQDIRIGVASASKNAPMILKALKIDEMFDCVVDPESIANGKPSPDIFLKAAEILEVNPLNCVGIEDAVAGINAIKSANMFSVGVGTVDQMREAGANLVINDTKDISLDLIVSNLN